MVAVVVRGKKIGLVTSVICVLIRGHRSEVMNFFYHMAEMFIYCCALTTVDSQGPFPLLFAT